MDIEVRGISQLLEIKKPEIDETEDVLAYVASQSVKSTDSMEEMVICIANIKKAHKKLDDEMKSWTDSIKKHVKRIESGFKPGLINLKNAESKGKHFLSQYMKGLGIERKKLVCSIGKENDPEKKEAIIKEAEEYIVPTIKGFSKSEAWTGEITDKEDLLNWIIDKGRLDLLTINDKELKRITNNLAKDPEIPGWKADKKYTISISVDKVLYKD